MDKASKFFISQEELADRLEEKTIKPVDASWYLPAMERNGFEEYSRQRICGAVFFDIDKIADQSSDLPHMLAAPNEFARSVGKMGLSKTDEIVVYDGPGLFSAARVWWNFKIMGARNVRIVEGGFDAWKAAGLPIETAAPTQVEPVEFIPQFNDEMVRDFNAVLENVRRGKSLVLDARPFARFEGTSPEPRKGLASGHIPGARSLPANEIVENGRLLPRDVLHQKLKTLAADKANHIITSCGSGVTAAIISLALDYCGYTNHSLYDGSWAQWGSNPQAPVARWV